MKINRLTAFISGLLLLSFGVILVIKANYGAMVLSALPYVLSERFTAISLGTFSYIVQTFVFILLIIIIRKINVAYFCAFLTSIVFGYCLDFANFVLKNLTLATHVERILLFIVGILCVGIGVALLVTSKLPLTPLDLFVREVSSKIGMNFGNFKIIFDVIMLIAACILSFIFFGKLHGIGITTIISSVINGTIIGYFVKLFEKHIVFTHKDNWLYNQLLSKNK